MSGNIFDIGNILNILDGEEFDERPVTIEDFVQDENYLGLPPLSVNQYTMIKASSQIYKLSTLVNLYGYADGTKRHSQTCTEVIMQLGKGSITDSSLVWTCDYGYRKPTELMEEYGVMLKSHNGERSSSAFFSEGYDDVFVVTTEKGRQIQCNMSHMLWGWKNNVHGKSYSMRKEISEYPLASLIEGDILAVNYGYAEPVKPVEISPDVARFIGYMIGDGSFVNKGNHGYNNPMFTNSSPEVQEDFTKIVNGLGGELKEGTSGFSRWRVTVNGITSLMVSLGLVGEHNCEKNWAGWWLNLTDESLAHLIGGIWSTDGWFHVQERNGHTSVSVAAEFTSRSVAEGIHAALTRMGIVSKMSEHRRASKATYRVQISSFRDARKFARLVPVVGKDLSSIVTTSESLGINEREPSFIYGERISSVKYAGKREVFTPIVEIDHSYTANGMIHSNSGKDYCSTIACAYIVYLLLCLKDPARYYGKPPGDTIDILNIAINAAQANNVFFKGFKNRIEKSPWFQGKFETKAGHVMFEKNINVYSGHSERESWEGYNVIYVVLDEISGFALESTSGNDQSKTAQSVYDMYRASVDSRFPDYGKVVLLSFPRFKNDFIQQKYDSVIAEKETIIRSHVFKRDENAPDGVDINEFEIQWEEDRIISYLIPKTFALKRPTWEVNPTKPISDFLIPFIRDSQDALARFACMPPDAVDAFFKDRSKIEAAFSIPNGVGEGGEFAEWFQPVEGVKYFVHVDLARKRDHCAVAIGHVEKWVRPKFFGREGDVTPFVVVDAVRWWTPSKDKNVDFVEVRDYIVSLRQRKFDVKLVTFDRWNSDDMISYLNSVGMKAGILSVAKKHYDDFAIVVQEERLKGPDVKLLRDELLALRIMNNDRVDHPRSGTKDLSDAVCGAIFNAIANTPRVNDREIEVHTYDSIMGENRSATSEPDNGVIVAPKKSVPPELADWLDMMDLV